jgi:hypothetical protein
VHISYTIENNSGVSIGRARNTYVQTPVGIQSAVKNAIAPYSEPAGIAISFGWNSVGFAKKHRLLIAEILLVSHGANKNDRIVIIEQKAANFTKE